MVWVISSQTINSGGKFLGQQVARKPILIVAIVLASSIGIIGCEADAIPAGQYTLTISSGRCGYVDRPGEGIFAYDKGTVVELVANAVGESSFVEWTGDVSTIADVEDASTTITMRDDYAITATFSCGYGMCFIATAAYGTRMAEEIGILSEFRDEYLLTNPLGQTLVNLYYSVSPPLADFIADHPSLKRTVRAGLLPAVVMTTVVVNATPAEKMAIVGLLVLFSTALTIWAIRRRRMNLEYS